MVGGGLVAADHGVPDVRLCIPTPPRIARRSHLAVPALYGLADCWGRDLVGYLDVPDFAFALRAKVREQLRDRRDVTELRSAQTETSRDILERGPAEYRQAVVDAVGAQLVKLRSVPSIVHRADQHAHAMTAHRLKLLDVEQQSAVALE